MKKGNNRIIIIISQSYFKKGKFFNTSKILFAIDLYTNGRFIQREYVVSSAKEQEELVKLLESALEGLREEQKESFEKETISKFEHNFGYGVKLRVKVKRERLKEYGDLRDKLVDTIVNMAIKKGIDLRTPTLVQLEGRV